MPLAEARAALRHHFTPNFDLFAAYVRDNWGTMKPLIVTWWDEYKLWEAQDTDFATAFYDSRMVSRTWDDKMEKKEVMMPAANKIKDRHGTFADKDEAVLKNYDQYKYERSVGLKSLGQRMTAKNFDPANHSASQKHALGLHDMSSTLLNPQKAISAQAHSKSNGTIFSFVSLSDPLDQAVFYDLNRVGKYLRNDIPELHEMVRNMRSKMTRVKLAAEHDLGTGFSAVERESGHGFKVTYGLGAMTKVINEEKTAQTGKGVVKQVPRTDEILQARREAALDFRTIVVRTLFDHTEIVIAYREHKGGYPLFTKYNKAANQFDPQKIQGAFLVADPTKAPIKDMPERH